MTSKYIISAFWNFVASVAQYVPGCRIDRDLVAPWIARACDRYCIGSHRDEPFF